MGISKLFDSPAGNAWCYFAELSKVPRPSKHEEKIREWLIAIAAEKGWEQQSDAIGNIVVSIPGKGALTKHPTLVLQGHMDMVCEKNSDVVHDFVNDPIEPRIDGEWVKGSGTTLGADNGVAMALGLALAEEELEDRMPLELLFTVDEETGLTGAQELDTWLLKGRHIMNLDSEEDGVLIIGCVGGVDMHMEQEFLPLEDKVDGALLCRIGGLRGGHSGVNINEDRANALLLAGRILGDLSECSPDLKLLSVSGGSKKNAIPREASFVVSGCDEATLNTLALNALAEIKDEEKGGWVEVHADEAVYERELPLTLVEFLEQFPNGVLEMEEDFPDLPRTSNSLGVIEVKEHGLSLIAHGRSSSAESKAEVCNSVEDLCLHCGLSFVVDGDYPGWQPYAESKILKHAQDIHNTVFGEEPRVEGIHAGLEAGIIGDKFGIQEMVAYGPTIENAHSPDECLSVESFERCYAFLKAFVSKGFE